MMRRAQGWLGRRWHKKVRPSGTGSARRIRHLGMEVLEVRDLLAGVGTAQFAAATSSFDEHAGTVQVPITLSGTGTLANNVTVTVAVQAASTATQGANADYTIASLAVTFPAGTDLTTSPTQNLAVTINDDLSVEGTETVVLGGLTISAPGDTIAAGSTVTHTLSITDNDTAATRRVDFPAPGNYTLRRSGGNLQLVSGSATFSEPIGSYALVLHGSSGDDTLTIDFTGGDPIPDGNVTFQGGLPAAAPGDRLILSGGNQGIVTYTYTGVSDGSIQMSNFGTVFFTGLEPITNTGTASDVIFNLPAGPNAATLSDDGTPGNGLSRLSGATFETTDFANPTNSLTINRGSAADTLTIQALPDFTAGLSVGSFAAPLATIAVTDNLALNSGSGALELVATAIDLGGAAPITLTTVSGQLHRGGINLVGDVTLAAGGGNLTLSGTIDGGFHLILNTTGSTTLGGAVGGTTALASLTTNAGGSTEINGATVRTTGNQTYGDPVTLNASTVLQAGGNVTFTSTVNGAFGLTVNTGGSTTFGGAVGGTTALTSLSTDAGGTTVINGGSITTNNGPISLADAVTLGADTTLNAGSGNITLGSTVNGAFALTLNSTGTTTLGGAVGGTTPLTSLTTNLGGSTVLSGGSITTNNGPISLGDAVTLGANTTLSAGSGNITLGSTVNGAFALTLNSTGTTTLAGAVGGTTALASLTTNAGGTTAINGGAVTTTGAQSYGDAVTLGANTTLTSTGSGAISFASTVNGAFSLTVNTGGSTTFGGAVGGSTPLTSLTTDAAGTTVINGGSITTNNGPISLGDAVTLGANTTLSAGSGDITLGSTVNGAFALTLNSTGTTTLAGAVGGTTPLASLTTNSGGTTAINGGAVTTTGAQSYGDAVTLGANTTLTAGSVTFQSTLGGAADLAQSLTISTTGSTTFSGNVGAGSTRLTTLDITSGGPVTQGAGTALRGNNLRLAGAGPFTLDQAGNEFVTLAANTSGALSYRDANALTIGTVGPTTGIHAATLSISAGGTLQVAAGVRGTAAVELTARESAASGDNLSILSGVTVESDTANVLLQAGDDFHLPAGSLVKAGAVGATITLASLDTAVDPAGSLFQIQGGMQATQIRLLGAADDDTFQIRFAGIVGPVEVQGGANTASVEPGRLRDGQDTTVDLSKRPYFVPRLVPLVVGDQLLADDSGLATPDVAYRIRPGQVERLGGATFLTFPASDIERLKLTTGPGNNDVTIDANGGSLPTIVQVDASVGDGPAADNRVQYEGSAGNDTVSIGDIDLHPALVTSAGPMRARVELKGVQRLWVRGNAGNDVIDNISSVPGVLDGGTGNDVINNIVNVSPSQLLFKGNQLQNSVFKNVSLVLGNAGADQLFTGSGGVDGVAAPGSVQAALKAFPDKGITFLVGDYTPAGSPNNPTLVAVAGGAGEPGDLYSSSAATVQHGFLALKDTAPARGLFRYGAGLGSIKFSSTIAWLKAQLFVGIKSVNQLVNVLQKQLREYTKDVPPSAGPEDAPPLPLEAPRGDGAGSEVPLMPARSDVNRDGYLAPLDALLIINDLNARGSRPLTAPSTEALDRESDAQALALDDASWMLDVNSDGYLTPLDALLIVNQLNAQSDLDAVTSSAGLLHERADEPLAPPVSNPPLEVADPWVTDELLSLLASSQAQNSPRRRT